MLKLLKCKNDNGTDKLTCLFGILFHIRMKGQERKSELQNDVYRTNGKLTKVQGGPP
jgi:hypothetical protein